MNAWKRDRVMAGQTEGAVREGPTQHGYRMLSIILELLLVASNH